MNLKCGLTVKNVNALRIKNTFLKKSKGLRFTYDDYRTGERIETHNFLGDGFREIFDWFSTKTTSFRMQLK